jgi:branched-chain amino acid transport system substrate-binding protein
LAALAALLLAVTAASAQDKVKIGLLTTLSGLQAAIGHQQRNGFQLALRRLGGQLGGREAAVLIRDDERKPDLAAARARALVEQDNVDFVVGPAFEDILTAIVPPVTAGGAVLIDPGPGNAQFAGKACNPDLFVTSSQTSQLFQVLGEHAQHTRIPSALAFVPDDQTGRDALAAIKHFYRGRLLAEVFVPPGPHDLAAEVSKIAAARPAAVFVVLPGRAGVEFVRLFRLSGLAQTVKFLSALTIDEATLAEQRETAYGLFGAANWAPNLDNAANAAFVADYGKAFGALPAAHAMQAYDAALLIDSALKATGGVTSDKAALRAALMKADFASPRGKFRFNSNHYPIQDFYLVKVGRRPDGQYQTEIVEKIFADYIDGYARDCPMK